MSVNGDASQGIPVLGDALTKVRAGIFTEFLDDEVNPRRKCAVTIDSETKAWSWLPGWISEKLMKWRCLCACSFNQLAELACSKLGL